jgi:hypothetical protein
LIGALHSDPPAPSPILSRWLDGRDLKRVEGGAGRLRKHSTGRGQKNGNCGV